MKTVYQVYMDFQAAEEQVQTLNRLASQMEDLANSQMESTLNRIGSSWKGENAEDYLAKADQLKAKIQRNAADIRKIANTVDRIATNTKNAELRAIRIAEENARKSH